MRNEGTKSGRSAHADMPSGELPIDRAIRMELVSPRAGRQNKTSLLSDDLLRRRGVNDVYLAARACLARAVALGEAAERSSQMNSKALKRSAEKAVRDQVRSIARATDGSKRDAPSACARQAHADLQQRRENQTQPAGVEEAVAAWHCRMAEWERQMRDLQSRADALALAGWVEDAEAPAQRAWVRRHYRRENVLRERTEARMSEIRTKVEAARDLLGFAADLMTTAFSELRAETPKVHGKFDAFFVTFINEFADFWETVTGGPPAPNGNAFETVVAAAHETLTAEGAYIVLPGGWDHRRATERHKGITRPAGDKAKQSPLNSKVRNALRRRSDNLLAFRSGNS